MCSYVNLILALSLSCLSNRGQANGRDYPANGQNALNDRVTPQNDYGGATGQNLHSQPGQNMISSQPSQDYRTGQNQSHKLGQNGEKGNISVPYNGQHSDSNGLNSSGVPVYETLNEIGGEQVSLTYRTEDEPNLLLWHVGIYSKSFTPYMQICGGTLVTMDAVITAAHCFWSDETGALLAEGFAVGAGKRYRPWADTHDLHSQTSDVSAIHIPAWFRGSLTSFQADIAVVRLARRLEPSLAVRPACVSFDEALDDEQLAEGNLGTVLGWGLTQPDGRPSPVLNYLELPVVPVRKCLDDAPLDYLKYITADKICAGVTTGKALCRGDSGGGLVFADARASPPAPHLRAVASTAPRDAADHACNAHALAALTHTSAHRAFLRRHVPGLEHECRRHYQYPGVAVGGSVQRIGNQFFCNCYCNSTRPK